MQHQISKPQTHCFLIGIIVLAGAFGLATGFVSGNMKDALNRTLLTLIATAFLQIFGQLLINFGKTKELPFGEISGTFFTISSIAGICGYFIYDCIRAIHTGSLQPSFELITSGTTTSIFMLFVASASIAALVLYRQKQTCKELAETKKQLRKAKDRLTHLSRECDAFNEAADKLKELHPEIDNQFWAFKREARQELTDQYRQKR